MGGCKQDIGLNRPKKASFDQMCRLSPDLVSRVRHSIERNGYCFFDREELARVFACVPGNHSAQLRVLHEFAEACGVEMETTPHLTSARFVRR
jgi:hypothetical protein